MSLIKEPSKTRRALKVNLEPVYLDLLDEIKAKYGYDSKANAIKHLLKKYDENN